VLNSTSENQNLNLNLVVELVIIDLILTQTVAELFEKIKVYEVINTPFLVRMYLVCILELTWRK